VSNERLVLGTIGTNEKDQSAKSNRFVSAKRKMPWLELGCVITNFFSSFVANVIVISCMPFFFIL
jgi:hypothetical protein